MDNDLKKEVLDVRKVIERSTSKVSLRDLEKKGFRQVKVLRAGDINQLIFKAVQNVLAKQPRGGGMSDEERQRIMKEARTELDQQLAEKRTLQAKGQQIEQAHQNLQAKLTEVNAQLTQEKSAFLEEKRQFERDRQALMERSLQGQQAAAANYEGQLQDLRSRLQKSEETAERARDMVPREEHQRVLSELARAEGKVDAAESRVRSAEQRLEDAEGRVHTAEARADSSRDMVAREEHEQVRRRLNTQVDDLQDDCDRYRKQLREQEAEFESKSADLTRLRGLAKELEEEQGQTQRFKRRCSELEDEEARASSKARGLQMDVERLEGEITRLKDELSTLRETLGTLREELASATANAASASGRIPTNNDAELQRMRMEMEQRNARMQEMIQGIATSLVEVRNNPAPAAAAAGGGDFGKQFEALQRNITSAMRKAAGKGKDEFTDLTAEQAAALFSNMEVADLQTNIGSVKVKEQRAAGVNSKLAKLRNMRRK